MKNVGSIFPGRSTLNGLFNEQTVITTILICFHEKLLKKLLYVIMSVWMSSIVKQKRFWICACILGICSWIFMDVSKLFCCFKKSKSSSPYPPKTIGFETSIVLNSSIRKIIKNISLFSIQLSTFKDCVLKRIAVFSHTVPKV